MILEDPTSGHFHTMEHIPGEIRQVCALANTRTDTQVGAVLTPVPIAGSLPISGSILLKR